MRGGGGWWWVEKVAREMGDGIVWHYKRWWWIARVDEEGDESVDAVGGQKG